MNTTFYEVLLVPQEAEPKVVRNAYEQSLANLTRRLRAARDKGADIAALEEERRGLEQAWAVLSDPVRRARYDRFLDLVVQPPPQEAGELWSLVSGSFLDPSTRATLELVRVLTDISVSDEPLVRLQEEPPSTPARAEAAPAAAPDSTGPRVKAPAPSAPKVKAPTPAVATVAGADPAMKAGDDLASLVYHHGYSGTLLRKLRQSRGISLDQVSSATRISTRYLEALEAGDFSRLPATTFVRGYLKEVARMLDLDPDPLVAAYLERMGRTG